MLLLLVSLWPVLSPFLAAALISYLVSSPATWLTLKFKGKLPYSVSAIACVLFFLLLFSGIFLLLVPVVISQIELIKQNLPKILAGVVSQGVPWLNANLDLGLSQDPAVLRQDIQSLLLGNSESIARAIGRVFSSGSGSVLGITGFMTLAITAALFMAPVWPSLLASMTALVPPGVHEKWVPVGHELNRTLSDYLKGIGVVVTFQGAFYAIGLSLAGLNAGWAIGLLAGVLSLIPYIGLTLSMVLAVFTALLDLQGVGGVLLVLGIFIAGQIIEGFILTPLVVGDRIGLSAVAVVFSLAFFGALFGLVGVVFALPLAACLKVLINRQIQTYKAS
ncbi:MAG: AI-2E family transporter, partial [Limnobacter sp.]|nr:AI-2E family transporter [Limnobacter sp.]